MNPKFSLPKFVSLVALLSLVGTSFGSASAAPIFRYVTGGTFEDGAVFAGYFDVDWGDYPSANGAPLVAWNVTVTAGPDFDAHVYRSTPGDDKERGRWSEAGCGGCFDIGFFSLYQTPEGGIDARVLEITSFLGDWFSVESVFGGETSSADILGCQIPPVPARYKWRCLEGTAQRVPEPASPALLGLGLVGLGLSRRRKA